MLKLQGRGLVVNHSTVVLFFLVFQVFFVSHLFPLNEILNEKPYFYIDNAYHWYYLNVISRYLLEGVVVGYDPFFNAGAAVGVHTDPSGHIAQLFSMMMMGAVSPVVVWKVSVFFMSVLGPLLPGLGLVVVRFRVSQVFLGFFLGLSLWWVSWFYWFNTAGMSSFVFSCFYSFFVILFVIRCLGGESLGSFCVCSLLVSFLVFVHPLPVVVCFLFFLCYFVFNFVFNFNYFVSFSFVLLLFVVGVLCNFWWIKYYFSSEYSSGFYVSSYQSMVYPENIIREVVGLWSGDSHGSKVYSLLISLVCVSFYTCPGDERRRFFWPFVCAWVLVEVYATCAGVSPVLARLTEPNRFAPAGYLLLVVPAVYSMSVLDGKVSFGVFEGKGRLFFIVVFLCVPFICIFVVLWELMREVSYGGHGRYGLKPPLVKALGGYSEFVLEKLGGSTRDSARILFETSLGRVHDGGHLAGYYARMSDREFIGGPYPFRYFSGFWDGFVFGSPIGVIHEDSFFEYLNLYNIGWVMAHSESSKVYFDKLPFLKFVDGFKEVRFYNVDIAHSFFMKGDGVIVSRDHNSIVLSGVVGDELVLKYHYVKGLKTRPYAEAIPIYIGDDPMPFLRIIKPPKNLEIYFGP